MHQHHRRALVVVPLHLEHLGAVAVGGHLGGGDAVEQGGHAVSSWRVMVAAT